MAEERGGRTHQARSTRLTGFEVQDKQQLTTARNCNINRLARAGNYDLLPIVVDSCTQKSRECPTGPICRNRDGGVATFRDSGLSASVSLAPLCPHSQIPASLLTLGIDSCFYRGHEFQRPKRRRMNCPRRGRIWGH